MTGQKRQQPFGERMLFPDMLLAIHNIWVTLQFSL